MSSESVATTTGALSLQRSIMSVSRIILLVIFLTEIRLCNAQEYSNIFSGSGSSSQSRIISSEQKGCARFDSLLANTVPDYINKCDCANESVIRCSIPDLCLNTTTTTANSTTTFSTSNLIATTVSFEDAGSNTQVVDTSNSTDSSSQLCAKVNHFEIDLRKRDDSLATVQNCLSFGGREKFCVDFFLTRDQSWECSRATYKGNKCACDVCEDRMSVTIDCFANTGSDTNNEVIAQKANNVTCQPFVEFAPFIPNFSVAQRAAIVSTTPPIDTTAAPTTMEPSSGIADYDNVTLSDPVARSNSSILQHEKILLSYGPDDDLYEETIEDAEKPPNLIFKNVLQTAVPILALLLVFEKIRGRLDRAVLNRPVYAAMANLFYREMATLAILQIMIEMSLEYKQSSSYQFLNLITFGKTQRTIVLVALLDFIQTAALHYFSNWWSIPYWESAENYSLNHYYELKDEFDQLDQLLYGNRSVKRIKCWINDTNLLLDGSPRSSCMKGLWVWIRHPVLKWKYGKLLSYLQFHAIRINVLSMNDLPPNFSFTSYLVKSQETAFIRMIENSNTKWLFLIVLQSFFNYFMAVVANISADKNTTIRVLNITISTLMILITGVAALISLKVLLIYSRTMRMKLLWEISSTNADTTADNKSMSSDEVSFSASQQRSKFKRLKKKQLQLFWLETPSLIMTALKLNHYSYAVAIATLMVFRLELTRFNLPLSRYALTLFLFAVFYLITMSGTISHYTMITSIGKLIDQKVLSEAVASHHLGEMHKSREERIKKANNKSNIGLLPKSNVKLEYHHVRPKSGFSLAKNPSVKAKFTQLKRTSRKVTYHHVPETYHHVPDVRQSFQPNESHPGPSEIYIRPKHFQKGHSIHYSSLLNSIKTKIRSYLLTEFYSRVSSVWFTILCVTIVSMRVGIFVSIKNIWELADATPQIMFVTFWLQAMVLLLFTAESLVILSSFHISALMNKGLIVICYAAVIDVTINVSCLVLLMVSEVLRCECYFDDEHYQGCSYTLKSLVRPSECCDFGKRTCGGVIEPFTVIVAIRAVRFYIAKYIVNGRKDTSKRFQLVHRIDTFIDDEDKSDDDSSLSDVSTVVDDRSEPKPCLGLKAESFVSLWETAVSNSSYIAEKYGKFSEEMLQTMLGIDILGEKINSTGGASNYLLGKNKASLSCVYENVSLKALEIIVAGMEGKAVKNTKKLDGGLTDKQDGKYFHVLFDIDDNCIRDQLSYKSITCLCYPNSSVVLGMRRCQRQYLPYLNTWTVVDVVLTKDEIIYFDIVYDGGKQEEFIAEAIKATSGGLGLRICDLVVGREIAGIIPIRDITNVWALTKKKLNEIEDSESGNPVGDDDEFWQRDVTSRGHDRVVQNSTRTQAWDEPEQDCLEVETISNNTLHLQFFCDHADVFDESTTYYEGEEKCCAFRWARIMGQVCEEMKSSNPRQKSNYKREKKKQSLFERSMLNAHNHEGAMSYNPDESRNVY